MYPAFREGDSLHIRYFEEPIEIQKISSGRVVLLQESSEWVVHRVIQRNKKKYTKGDWSYPLDNSSKAWGEVIAVNGESVKAVNSPYIAKISARLKTEQPKSLRLLRKIQLVLISTVLRNLIERRSL